MQSNFQDQTTQPTTTVNPQSGVTGLNNVSGTAPQPGNEGTSARLLQNPVSNLKSPEVYSSLAHSPAVHSPAKNAFPLISVALIVAAILLIGFSAILATNSRVQTVN